MFGHEAQLPNSLSVSHFIDLVTDEDVKSTQRMLDRSLLELEGDMLVRRLLARKILPVTRRILLETTRLLARVMQLARMGLGRMLIRFQQRPPLSKRRLILAGSLQRLGLRGIRGMKEH